MPDLTVKSDGYGVWVKNPSIITSSEIVQLYNPKMILKPLINSLHEFGIAYSKYPIKLFTSEL